MPEEKATTAKKTTKKIVAVTEAAKPKKASAPKAASAAAKPAAPAKTATAATPAKAPAAKPVGETKKKTPAAKKLVAKPTAPSQEERQRWVATAAYHRAEKRGFAPGYEVQDWLDAEEEISKLVGKP